MNTISAAALIISVLQLPAFAAPQAQKASLAGVVLNADGEPLPNARVTLGKLGVNLGPFFQLSGFDRETTIPAETLESVANYIAREATAGNADDPAVAFRAAAFRTMPVDDIYEFTVTPAGVASVVYKSTPPVVTDDRGRFLFDALDPGSYRLTFSASGYAKRDYAERAIGVGGVPLTLTAGQSKTDIVMRMVKVGAISGLIRDSAGQPVTGVRVELFRATYDKTGQRKAERVAIAHTDDLGEYRMYALLPGRYYLTAGGQDVALGPNSGSGDGRYWTPNRVPQNYTRIYYPGAANQASATAIEVQSGAEVRGIDLLVSLLPHYRVRGRVVDLKTGKPPQRVSLGLNFRDQGDTGLTRSRPVDLLAGINPNYKAAEGSFELPSINAGAYFLGAAAADAPPQGRSMGFVPLNVDADVDGVVLALGVGGSLKGHLRVESNAGASTALPLNFVQLQLKNADLPIPMEFEPQPSLVAADGSFHIDNLRPGDYRISIPEMPKGFYLKAARVGEIDVLNAPLHYGLEDTAVLNLVLSPNVGLIDGRVLDAAGQPSAGAQVVLIPNENRKRTELYRQITADINGRFAIPSVAPGEYTLAAWETLELYGFFDVASMRQAEGQGKVVRVSESTTLGVNLSAIPSR